MSSLVIVLLAALWGSILLPGLWRERRRSDPLASITSFERCMQLLAPRSAPSPARQQPGRHVMVLDEPAQVDPRLPASAARLARRRRAVLQWLLVLVPATAVVALLVGGGAWLLPPAAATLYAAYAAEDRRLRHRARYRSRVHQLPLHDTPPAYDVRPRAVGE